MRPHIRSEAGSAVIIALMVTVLMIALGSALILTTSTNTIISGNFRHSIEALYAADAVLERSLDDLGAVADWSELLDGRSRSTFIDGRPGGERQIGDGSRLNLDEIVNLANCEEATRCTDTDLSAMTVERPWGANNPRWQLYAYGRLTDLAAEGAITSPFYVVVLVADDPSETDNDPQKDGGGPANPGAGVLALRAQAFGPRGAHETIDLTVARIAASSYERASAEPSHESAPLAVNGGIGGVRLLSWRRLP